LSDERRRLIRSIESMIDESRDDWRKVAFYSDPEVSKILERIYKRWEDSGFEGIPLEHAEISELRVLAAKAANIKPVPVWSAGDQDKSRSNLEFFRRIYRKLSRLSKSRGE